ncbi:MAG: germination protein M [Bacillota bacterium]|nr:MAG: germination protein M [Bacillota bacterium]MBS3949240.1 GerMN domain-containing protein [Peptococcaceae bacterium]
MNNRRLVRLLALVVLIALSASLLVGCLPWPFKKNSTTVLTPGVEIRIGSFIPISLPVMNAAQAHQRTLWVWDHTKKYVVPFVLSVPKVDGVAREAINRIIDSPVNRQSIGSTGLKLPLPEGTAVRGLTIRDGLAKVDFSEEFLRYSTAREKLVVDAVVLTLTEFPNVDQVQIMVGGKTIPKLPGGTDLDKPIRRSNIKINPEAATSMSSQGTPVTLYFSAVSTENYIYFVPVTRSIANTDNVLVAVVNELIAGPAEGSGLLRDVPATAKVKSARLSAMRVAELDLTAEIYNFGKGAIAEMAMLGSIILALTEQKDVTGVKITVDGKTPIMPAGTDVSKPVLRPMFVNPFIF